jgi:hypothetical protein
MTGPNPKQPNPEQTSFEPIVVSYALTADDYGQYAAAVSRRNRNWSSFYIFVAVVFLAIPVALFFRSVAARRLDDPAIVELAGHFTLYAYETGVAAAIIRGYVARWTQRKRYFEATWPGGSSRPPSSTHWE